MLPSLTMIVSFIQLWCVLFANFHSFIAIIIGYCTFFKVIIIGFTNTSYTVSESDGVANIQIRVIQGLLGRRQVTVEFSTGAVSAASK